MSLEQTTDIRQLGEQVAAALTKADPSGRHWHVPPVNPDRDCRHFVNIVDSADPECRLSLNNSWASKGRLTIGGSYPSHGNGYVRNDDAPKSITVAKDKSPEAIARDAARRFIPAYLEALATAKERRDEHASYEQRRDTLARELAERCNTRPHSQSPGRWSAYRNSGGYLSDGEANGDGTVKLDMRSVSADKACRIIAILMED